MGSKNRGAEKIIELLNNPFFDNMDYIEPFIGYAHILRRIVNKNSYTASDNNLNLMNLYAFLKNTNEEYPEITKEEYHYLKQSNLECYKYRRAFAAFAYSFNGKEFGGYTGCDKNGKDWSIGPKKYYNKLRSNDTFKSASISLKNYSDYIPNDKLIYCDPPYASTTKYGKSTFDSKLFWETMRNWSVSNWVFVSEYNAPRDFMCIISYKKHCGMAHAGGSDFRTEKVFIHNSRYNEFIVLK
jgi:DNA adenine methylase